MWHDDLCLSLSNVFLLLFIPIYWLTCVPRLLCSVCSWFGAWLQCRGTAQKWFTGKWSGHFSWSIRRPWTTLSVTLAPKQWLCPRTPPKRVRWRRHAHTVTSYDGTHPGSRHFCLSRKVKAAPVPNRSSLSNDRQKRLRERNNKQTLSWSLRLCLLSVLW